LIAEQKEMQSRILLVAGAWDNLAEMPYLIRQSGFYADILCPEENISRHSSFLNQWIDSGNSWASLIKTLLDLDQSGVYSHILIGEDPLLWQIYNEPVKDLTHLLPIREPKARAMMGKIHFAQLCLDLDIPTPKFSIIESPEHAKMALLQLGLPIVTKVNYSSSGQGVRIHRDRESLLEYAAQYKFAQPLLAQQFIEGETLSVEALFSNGQLLEYICSVDIDPTLGPSTKRRYMPRISEIRIMLKRLGEFAKLHGFANVTILREVSSGALYLIEADPRPNKWVHYAQWFGANFVEAFRLFINNDQISNPPHLNYLAESIVTHWDIEHFDTHFLKLLRADKPLKAVIHLLDFDNTLRYVLHDPFLLREKTLRLRKQFDDKLD